MAYWKKYQTRYSGHKRFHYVCLKCRKSFKLEPRAPSEPLVSKCPDCGRKLLNMGPDFKPPRRYNKHQWRKVDMLAKCGLTFYASGFSPGPHNIKTLADAKGLVREYRRRANADMTAQRILREKKPIRRLTKQHKSIAS